MRLIHEVFIKPYRQIVGRFFVIEVNHLHLKTFMRETFTTFVACMYACVKIVFCGTIGPETKG